MAVDNVVYDINGYDIVTKSIQSLLNQFPLLDTNEEIGFSVVDAEQGIVFIPVSGATVEKEVKDVTGHVEQECSYPFIVFYKASGLSENGKVNAKEWLDTLGMWLERQVIDVNGVEHQLTKYPPLNRNRKFTEIERTTTAYLYETTEDRVDCWAVNITARYKNEYDLLG